MESDQAKRFDRIVAILIQLQSKRIVKAKDLAERFKVSLRTIYRDMSTLEASGVPILSEAGVGYSIMEGYKLPPVMFTKEEAASFVTAEKLMTKYTDKVLEDNFKSAMFKVKSVLRWSEKDMVDTLDNSMLVRGNRPVNAIANIPNVLDVLISSITGKKQVELHYQTFDAEQAAWRNVEPVGLFHEHSHWYMMAYCHLRKAYRQFRTDRILNIKELDKAFEHQHENLEHFINDKSDSYTHSVVVWAEKHTARYLKGAGRMLGQFVNEKMDVDGFTYTINTSMDDDSFCRVFLMFADGAKIVSPAALNETLKRVAGHLKNIVDTR